jgi:DNA-binding transcriptional MerR regulator
MVSASESMPEEGRYYSAAQAAKFLGVTKRTLLKWEQQKMVPRPQRVKRGQLEYRAYGQRELDQIRLFIQSRLPNPNIQIIGNDSDGVPIFGQKLRGPSVTNMRAAGTPNLGHLPKVHTSLNEALGATCVAALQMNATSITLRDAEGNEFAIEIRAENEESQQSHDGPKTAAEKSSK